MHRRLTLRVVPPPAAERGAKVICLDALRKARLKRCNREAAHAARRRVIRTSVRCAAAEPAKRRRGL